MKPIKLSRQQLRGIIMQESKRLSEAGLDSGGSHFEIQDMPFQVEQDKDLMEAIENLCHTLSYFCQQLAVKEGLASAEHEHEVSDMLIPEADADIRQCVYDFVKKALLNIEDMEGEF